MSLINKAKNLKSKVQSTVKKVASTNFGKKLVEAVKKAAPVAQAVVKATPQYQAYQTVKKVAPTAVQAVSRYVQQTPSQVQKQTKVTPAYIAPKQQQPSVSKGRAKTSFGSKLMSAVKSVPTSISDVFQNKAYASETASDVDETPDYYTGVKYYGKGNWLGMPDFGFSEGLARKLGMKPNYKSIEKALIESSEANELAKSSAEIGLNKVNLDSLPKDFVLKDFLGRPYQTPSGSYFSGVLRDLGSVLGVSSNRSTDRTDKEAPYSPKYPFPPEAPRSPEYKLPPIETTLVNPGITSNTDNVGNPPKNVLDDIKDYLPPWVILDNTNTGDTPSLEEIARGNYDDISKYLNEQSKLQKKQLENMYKKILNNYENMTDEEKASADRALGEIKDKLDMLYNEGEQAKREIENMYEDAERRRIKADRLEEARLRNLFSSLGTAESSSFIDKLMSLKQEQGSDLYRADIEKRGKIADVINLINRGKSELERDESEIKRIRDNNIRAIMRAANLTEEEKTEAIMQQNLAALANLIKARQDYQNLLLQNRQTRDTLRAQLLAAMIPGIMQERLLEKYKTLPISSLSL